MKSILNLSIDTETLALIKQREGIESISGFVEGLFKVELGLKVEEKTNEIGELKIMNAKMTATIEKQKIDIKSLEKQIKDKPNKKTEEEPHIYAQSPR